MYADPQQVRQRKRSDESVHLVHVDGASTDETSTDGEVVRRRKKNGGANASTSRPGTFHAGK